MKNKIFATLLFAILLTSFASALTLSSSNSLTDSVNSTVITVNNNQAVNQSIALSIPTITQGSSKVEFTLSPSSISNLANQTSATLTLSRKITGDFTLGKYIAKLTAIGTDANSTATNVSLDIEYIKEFCEDGNVNASSIRISSVDDKEKDNENAWQWKPRQNIEVDVKAKNQLDEDESFVVELGIWDSEQSEFVEIDGDDTITQDVDIDEGDTETVKFEFESPLDMEKSSSRYILYVKAYVDGDEELVCNSGTANELDSSADEAIEVDRDTREVVLDNIEAPDTVTAGETITISAIIYNIGEKDEDKVKFTVINSKLSINEGSSGSALDIDDSESVSLDVTIPENAADGAYTIDLRTLFDYDDSRDVYKKTSKDTWNVKINVIGGAAKPSTATVGITASLISEAEAGEELVVKSTITNTGKETTTFVIDGKGYDSWATLLDVSPRVLTLKAGESKDVIFKFEISDDASGQQSFAIETNSNGKLDSKTVSVNLAEDQGFDLGSLFSGGNSLIYIIAAVNLILIILIIIVAIRISRR